MLIRIVKNWTEPDLLRQTPNGEGVWHGVRFTLDSVERCDGLLILNELRDEITVSCPRENIWAIFQEPYLPDFMPWLKCDHDQFARVYTTHPPNSHHRYHSSHPMVPWHIGKTYDELNTGGVLTKTDRISWITSALQVLPGHVRRHAFYRYLSDAGWSDLDIWGRGIRPVEDKWDVLAGCRYGIAVENHIEDNYWTEKVADCWLTETLPFYCGCPNLERFFPEGAFIRVELNDFKKAARIIRQAVDSGEYENRLPAIREAKDLVLNRYQFFPHMAKEFQGAAKGATPSTIHLSPFRQGPLKKVRNHLMQRFHLYKASNAL